MSTFLIIVGFILVGYWGFFTGKDTPNQPLNFRSIGPKALTIGVVLLIIGFSIG